MKHLQKNDNNNFQNSGSTLKNSRFFSKENFGISEEEKQEFHLSVARQIEREGVLTLRGKETSLDRMPASKEGGRD